jgi:hypothetical protein
MTNNLTKLAERASLHRVVMPRAGQALGSPNAVAGPATHREVPT